jgi:phosphatidylcholine synthase
VSRKICAAIAIHLFTASGAVCGLLALQAAARHEWQIAFFWLGVAVIIDAADGPLARRLDVASILPRFDGARLDEVVDYLNYCVVPAFILLERGIITEWRGPVAAAAILLAALFHFADRESKTQDGYFVGFPAIWNVACFYLLVFGVGENIAIIIIVMLVALTFVPLKWVHPLRVRKLRPLTIVIVTCWSAAAIATIVIGFPAGRLVQTVFAATALYMLALGISRTFAGKEDRRG